MKRRMVIGLALSSVLMPASASVRGETPDAASENFFELRVRPVLANHCVKCHGETKQSGGLRVDSREALLKGGENGPAIVAGDPAAGLLGRAISHTDDDLKMPPSKPLPKAAQDDLAAWIAAGSPWPASVASRPIEGDAHWAFEPLRQVSLREDPTGWAASPIDRLIAEARRPHGLHPVERADRRTLIRRATVDLIGLPPDPARVEAFAADDRPDAYEKLLDELLASPQYGERWARGWLDLARYADTAGDNSDYPIPEAYLYRNYVIDAFNADVPYDRFLHEQIAGDVLAQDGPSEDYARRVIATGFLAQAKRFGTRKLEDGHQIIEDVLNTTGQVVLGLSLRCARCHDHKFDPITSKDYYALYGFFAATKFPFAGAEEDHRPSEFAPLVPPQEIGAYQARYDAALASLTRKAKRAQAEEGNVVDDRGFTAAVAAFVADVAGPADKAAAVKELEEARAEYAAARRKAAKTRQVQSQITNLVADGAVALAPRAYAVRDGEPTVVKLQIGGDPNRLDAVIPRGVPKILEPSGSIELPSSGSGRLALARWLTEGRPQPLVARVMANRIWQHHFGKAIVPTPSDFGLRGTPPTHPDLLEWLAADFVASGWSIKAMHRRIMLSETYQLASRNDPANAAKDTGNAWYWRFDRRPLDAEALRDSLLALGGDLRLDRPGSHPFPPEESWGFTAHHQFKAVYPSDHRSIYLMVQRLHPHPYLALFNGPDASATTAVRDASTVAIQALFMVNNPFVHEQARKFAGRLLESDSDDSSRIQTAYLRAYGRPPTDAERARADAFLREYGRSLAAEGLPADRLQGEAWAGLARAMLASNEFLYVD
ncbi:PSD1 and planctomycete cytochrome C domain-containing protein [Paludisphaera rhizosphaerae]|uniref:PSD1 and planctomycete cytochrome C domain-containing protein n=1 Tax=Paludisphaera rhizosphaerae TaxID=2711216 RepID=UPI0013ED4FA7|nr:PSD1 and planctomycete cytochrome C domain-containing protein [Paludisphaera rhizosphaerae]